MGLGMGQIRVESHTVHVSFDTGWDSVSCCINDVSLTDCPYTEWCGVIGAIIGTRSIDVVDACPFHFTSAQGIGEKCPTLFLDMG